MSYIPFDLKAFRNCFPVAMGCGARPADISHGLLSMWIWAFDNKSDIVTAEQVRGFFGVDAIAQLEAFEFLEQLESGYRVRGAMHWLGLKKIENARKAGLASAAKGAFKNNLKQYQSRSVTFGTDSPNDSVHRTEREPEQNTEHPPNQTELLSSNIQHPTSNTNKKTAGLEKTEPAVLPQKSVKPKRTEKTTNPNHATTVQLCCDIFLEETGAKYGFAEADAKAVSNLLAKGEPPEIARRWRKALRENAFPKVRSLLELQKHWNHFVEGEAEKTNGESPMTIALKQCAACHTGAKWLADVWGIQLCAPCQTEWRDSDCPPSTEATIAWIATKQTQTNGAVAHG